MIQVSQYIKPYTSFDNLIFSDGSRCDFVLRVSRTVSVYLMWIDSNHWIREFYGRCYDII